MESKPKALKGAPRFVVAGPAKGGVKTISAKETRTEAKRRGATYQNNLVATQQTLEDMYLHTARVPLPFLFGHGWTGRQEEG